ncbi:hypothetical protein P3T23_001005 [Paraburkholderia sp. GAS448]|uniref:hypothetical protein n=1 Tax=Paraburkholderia sp. GAS448 TaxID=3035136 RepID=UPI003D211179
MTGLTVSTKDIGELQLGTREGRKRISTASGRAQFEYCGDTNTGIEVFYGERLQFSGRASSETIHALVAEFASRPGPVYVGTSFDTPALGTIGDWLLSREKQNLACYLIPVLADLGLGAYETGNRRFSFSRPDDHAHANTSDTKTPLIPTESFDGGSLATEAGKMMSRIAEEVTRLVLSPVQQIECSLSHFASAEALRCRLGEWSLPEKGEFVVYRFQTEAPEAFHTAFPESTARTFNLSRKNELMDDSDTLYVGSSRDFASRLQQHFGFGHEGTYALHLKRWVPESLCHTPLVLEYWTVRDSKQVRSDVLQTLEDYLWDHSRPIFGRRGSR